MRGDPRDEIVRKIKELNATCLIIGSRGLGMIKRFIFIYLDVTLDHFWGQFRTIVSTTLLALFLLSSIKSQSLYKSMEVMLLKKSRKRNKLFKAHLRNLKYQRNQKLTKINAEIMFVIE